MDAAGVNLPQITVFENRTEPQLSLPVTTPAVFNTRPVRALFDVSEYVGRFAYRLLEGPCHRVLTSYRLYPCEQLYQRPVLGALEIFPEEVWLHIIKKLDEPGLKSLGRVDTSLHTLTLGPRLSAHYQKIVGDNSDLPALSPARRDKLLSLLKANGVPDRVVDQAEAKPVRYWGLFRACGQIDARLEDVLSRVKELDSDVDEAGFGFGRFLSDSTVLLRNGSNKKDVLLDPEDRRVSDSDSLGNYECFIHPLKDNRVITLNRETGEINVFLKQEDLKLAYQKTIKGPEKPVLKFCMLSSEYVIMLTETGEIVTGNISTDTLSLLQAGHSRSTELNPVYDNYLFVIEPDHSLKCSSVKVFHRAEDKINYVEDCVVDYRVLFYIPVSEQLVACLNERERPEVVKVNQWEGLAASQALNCNEPILDLVALPNEELAGLNQDVNNLYIWRLAQEKVSPEPIRVIRQLKNLGHYLEPESMVDGRLICLGQDYRTLTVINPVSGARFSIAIENAEINYIQTSNDGRLLLRKKNNEGFILCDLFSCPP